jgi:hypothetical protein
MHRPDCFVVSIASIVMIAGSRATTAQGPVANKETRIDAGGTALSVPAPAKAANAGDASQSDPLSDECRRQYQVARDSLWARDSTLTLKAFGCSIMNHRLNTSAEATEYFGNFAVGDAIAATYGGKQTTLYTELVSDNLWTITPLGYARVGLSAQASGTGAQEQPPTGGSGSPTGPATRQTAVDQLFQGGGNAILHFTVPSIVYRGFVGDTPTDLKPTRSFDSFFQLGFGADLPELNGALDSRSASVRLAWQGAGTQRTVNENFRFLLQLNAAGVSGFTDGFYKNLVGADVKQPKIGMLVGRATIGVEIAKVARVGASFGWTTLDGVRQKGRLTVQLLNRGAPAAGSK